MGFYESCFYEDFRASILSRVLQWLVANLTWHAVQRFSSEFFDCDRGHNPSTTTVLSVDFSFWNTRVALRVAWIDADSASMLEYGMEFMLERQLLNVL